MSMPDKPKKYYDSEDERKNQPPEMTIEDEREDSPEYWKRKYLDSEREKATAAQNLRAEVNKKEEELRKFRAESSFIRDDLPPSLQVDGGMPSAYPQTSMHRGSGPYKLFKDMPVQAGRETIMMPQEISGCEFQKIPKVEDIPAFILSTYGSGLYKVRDKNGEYVVTFTVQPAIGSFSPPQPQASPPPQAYPPMSAMMMSGSPAAIAYEMYKEAVSRGDPFLLSQAQELFKSASKPQDSVRSSFQEALGLVTGMMGMMQQMKGAFGSGMGMSDLPEAVQIKKLEADIEAQKWQGYGQVANQFGQYVERGITSLAARFAPKVPDQAQVSAAAAKMGGSSTPPSPQTPRFTPSAPPPVPQSPPQSPPQQPTGDRAEAPGTFVHCGGCKKKFIIDDYLKHLDEGKGSCPNMGSQIPMAETPSAAPQVPGQTPMGGIPMGTTNAITQDMATYLDLMPTLTYYIMGWDKGDAKCHPEAVGDFVWMGLQIPGREDQKRKLLSVVEKGYDSIAKDQALLNIIASLQRFPNFTRDEIVILCNAAIIAKMLKPEELQTMQNISDLAPVVDSFQNHYTIQTSTRGREWFGRFLNFIAKSAGKPQPHPEYMEGAANQKKPGAGNL